MGKKVVSIVIVVFFGALILGGGFVYLTGTDVRCGSEVMHRGDTCETTQRGRTIGNNDYAEQAEANTRYGYAGIGIGVLLLGYGGWSAYKLVKEKKAAAAAVPVLPPKPVFPTSSPTAPAPPSA